MSFQDEMNRIAGKPGNWNSKDCLNSLAGDTSDVSRMASANTYAGTTNLSTQLAINSKAGITDMNLSKQLAAAEIPTP